MRGLTPDNSVTPHLPLQKKHKQKRNNKKILIQTNKTARGCFSHHRELCCLCRLLSVVPVVAASIRLLLYYVPELSPQ